MGQYIDQSLGNRRPFTRDILDHFSPQVICALWLGKYGYTILDPMKVDG